MTARREGGPPPVCITTGGVLTVVGEPSPAQPWQPVASSNSAVIGCSSSPGTAGTLLATCRADTPGTAVLTSTTAPFSGDPHGPAQALWRLTVIVRR